MQDCTEDPLVRRRDAAADAWGVTYSALLFNMVFTMEVFLADEESADAAAVRADPRDLRAALRARCAILRSGAAVGAHAPARAVRQPAPVEGEQLSPLATDLPDRAGRRRARLDGRRSSAPRRRRHAGPEDDSGTAPRVHAAQRIPYRAHVAPASSAPNSATTCRRFVWAARVSKAATMPSSTIGTSGSTSCGGTSRVPSVALWTHVIRRRASDRTERGS